MLSHALKRARTSARPRLAMRQSALQTPLHRVQMMQAMRPQRMFATMTMLDADDMHELQSRFENNPSDTKTAYELFRKLNEHGMHDSVIRLYFKHEMGTQETSGEYADRMQNQYEFARDHLD